MSVLYSPHFPATGRRLRQVPQTLWIILVLALTLPLGFELSAALKSPGQAIRGELETAAADLQSPRPVASEGALARLHQHFRDHDVTIDASGPIHPSCCLSSRSWQRGVPPAAAAVRREADRVTHPLPSSKPQFEGLSS